MEFMDVPRIRRYRDCSKVSQESRGDNARNHCKDGEDARDGREFHWLVPFFMRLGLLALGSLMADPLRYAHALFSGCSSFLFCGCSEFSAWVSITGKRPVTMRCGTCNSPFHHSG